MMIRNLIDRFRKKGKPLRFLGRGGIAYNNGSTEYYIETENILSKEAGIDVAIYYRGIKVMDNGIALTDSEKKHIAEEVKSLMEQKGAKVGIFPI